MGAKERHALTDEPVLPLPTAPDGERGTVPPVEDLFSITMDEIDFMSAQSFPASDPPPPPSAIAPRRDRGYSTPTD